MTEVALQLTGVSKAYGNVTAIKGLDLDVKRGELLTLLGPSGSGKTTTLMISAGFTEADTGTVFLQEQDVTHTPPQKRGVGVVFQNYALFPHKTVAENIAFPLRMRSIAKREQEAQVEDALATVRLSGYGNRYPKQLSGGQQQRVALARALVFNPPLLLMDEPLGALDKNLRTEMQLEIKRLQEDLNLTIVYVTHDQQEALTLSHRVAVMNHGELVQLDTPENLYANPADPFVASFVGDTNLFQGELKEQADGQTVMMTDPGTALPVESPTPVSSSLGTLAIRPERVMIRPAGEAESLPFSRSGTIEEVAYLGDAWIYEVVLAAGDRLRIKQSLDMRDERFNRNDSVEIGWVPAQARLLGSEE